jgi:hypothetical protein
MALSLVSSIWGVNNMKNLDKLIEVIKNQGEEHWKRWGGFYTSEDGDVQACVFNYAMHKLGYWEPTCLFGEFLKDFDLSQDQAVKIVKINDSSYSYEEASSRIIAYLEELNGRTPQGILNNV